MPGRTRSPGRCPRRAWSARTRSPTPRSLSSPVWLERTGGSNQPPRRSAKATAARRTGCGKRSGRGNALGRICRARLGGAHAVRARALLALLDLEGHGLAATQAVEVKRLLNAAAMEEVLFPVLGGDEAKAAVGHDLLHGSLRHLVSLLLLEPDRPNARPVREDRKGPRRSSLGIPKTPHSTKWRPGTVEAQIEAGFGPGPPGGERGHPRPVTPARPGIWLPRQPEIKPASRIDHPLSPGTASRSLGDAGAGWSRRTYVEGASRSLAARLGCGRTP